MGWCWRGASLLGALAVLAAVGPATSDDSNKRVVCYYTNWSVYRPGTAKFSPQNINPYLCTHLIYAFGGLTRENGIRAYDKYQDIEQGGYAKFTGLKTYNKQLKTLLAIGGWNEGSARFSPMVADPERRAEFVKNAVRFLRTNHFDGLDLDWEYPAYRDGGKAADRDNYAALVQELREEFDKESKKTGRPRLLLTMAVPAGIEYIDKGYDVPRLNKYLDFMNILSYDYHSAFESSVNHHSPLYPIGEDDEYNFEAALSIDYTIKHYIKMGASRDKLVLGIPTYGRSYTLFNPDSTELGAPSDGPGEQGDATREKGYLAYYEICEAEGWEVEKPHPKAMGPYAVKGNQWVGYDDTDIVRLKAEYVVEKGLGGIMFWSIDNDDFRGKCHNRPYPLIEAAKEALLGSTAKTGSERNLVSSKTTKGGKSSQRESSTSRSDTALTSSPRRTNKLKPKAPASTRRTTVATTPSPASTTPHPPTTPEPPSTPDPGSDFVCKDEGFFPHPRDCKKYFWCLDSGPSNLGIVAHQFTCPSGLFFNKAADSCDYARNVICNKKTTAAPATTAATSTTTAKPSAGVSRTTTTTTTTTTTEAPVEEEEEEEVEEDDDDAGQEDPEALKELLNLIKKLGGVEELEKQLRGDKGGSDPAVEASPSGGSSNSGGTTSSFRNRSLVERVLQGRNRNAASFSTTPASSVSATTPRYKSLFRNGPSRPQNDGIQDAKETSSQRDRERPKYVSIRRERPTVTAELEEEVQNEPEETAVEARTRSRYDKPKREQDDDDEDADRSKPATPGYVTLRRNRPADEADVTTSRYVTLQRARPSTTTTEAAVSSLEEEEDDEEVESASSEEDKEDAAVAVVTPTPSSSPSPYREGPVYRPTPLRTTRPDVADDEETTATATAATTTTTAASPKVSAERVSLRRPGGFLNHGSRGRRPTTTTPAPTTTTTTTEARRTPPRVIRRRKPSVATTETPVDSDSAAQTTAASRDSSVNRGQSAAAAAQRRRKFRPEARTTTFSPRDEEATATTSSELTTERGRYSFPKRGRSRAQSSEETTSTPTSTAEQAATVTASATAAPGEPLQGRELNELLARALQEQQLQDERTQRQQLQESDLSDLTHPAVVAIHTLATQAAGTSPVASTPSPFTAQTASPNPQPQSSSFTHVRTGGTSFSTSLSSLPSTVPDSPPSRTRQHVQQHHTATPLTTPPPVLEIRVPVQRGRGSAARRLPQGSSDGGLGADDVPRLRSPRPQLGSLGVTQLGQVDYEYYDDEADAMPSATKVKIHGDGWIECLDRGNFPHPFSCRKFISCAKMESGDLQGWEYTCPRGLSFDPIGGICNWSAGLGCKG